MVWVPANHRNSQGLVRFTLLIKYFRTFLKAFKRFKCRWRRFEDLQRALKAFEGLPLVFKEFWKPWGFQWCLQALVLCSRTFEWGPWTTFKRPLKARTGLWRPFKGPWQRLKGLQRALKAFKCLPNRFKGRLEALKFSRKFGGLGASKQVLSRKALQGFYKLLKDLKGLSRPFKGPRRFKGLQMALKAFQRLLKEVWKLWGVQGCVEFFEAGALKGCLETNWNTFERS